MTKQLTTITPQQSRMARAGLGWSTEDLAERSGVSKPTIQRFESGQGVKDSTVEEIAAAFAKARVKVVESGPLAGAVYVGMRAAR